MRFARSCLAAAFFVLYGLGSLAIGGLLFPPLALFGARRAMRALVRGSWVLFVRGMSVLRLLRVEISPEDRRRLAAAHGVVVAANHLALIDICVLMTLLPDATAVAKAEARSNFFYSLIVRGVFLVNSDPQGVLEEAKRLLAAGTSLVVFPEGTRTPADAPHRKLRRGAAQIALHAGAPIQPVFLEVDPPVLAKGQPWHDVADRTIVWRIRVREPIDVSPAAAGGTHAAAVALTRAIYDRLWPCES